MPGFLGRLNTLTWGGVTIAGVREKSLKVNGTAVDETTGDDSGWRVLLSTPGEKTFDLDISGVVRDKTLPTDFFAGNVQKAMVYTRSDGSVISGTFHLENYNQTDPYNNVTTFDASFKSSGAVVFTP